MFRATARQRRNYHLLALHFARKPNMTLAVNFSVPAAGTLSSTGQVSFSGTDTNNQHQHIDRNLRDGTFFPVEQTGHNTALINPLTEAGAVEGFSSGSLVRDAGLCSVSQCPPLAL
jgi:hypothetical protein